MCSARISRRVPQIETLSQSTHERDAATVLTLLSYARTSFHNPLRAGDCFSPSSGSSSRSTRFARSCFVGLRVGFGCSLLQRRGIDLQRFPLADEAFRCCTRFKSSLVIQLGTFVKHISIQMCLVFEESKTRDFSVHH